jgi:hypothetical protein
MSNAETSTGRTWRHGRRLLFLLLGVVALAGTTIAAAASVGVGSGKLWAGGQSLTKGTCTLTGTSQTSDTWVNQGSPTSTYGTNRNLRTQRRNNRDRWAFVTFDLSSCGIPSTGGADSATLTLTLATAPTQSRTLDVDPVLSPWSDTSLTWNSAQSLSFGSTTGTFTSGTTSGVSFAIAVTGDVDSMIKNSSSIYGWRISDPGGNSSSSGMAFASSEAASGNPTLTIDWEK